MTLCKLLINPKNKQNNATWQYIKQISINIIFQNEKSWKRDNLYSGVNTLPNVELK